MLPIAAVGLIVLLALAGGGIDLSRAYKVHSRLQSACDAGVLAGRRAVATAGFDATAKAKASSFFAINFDASAERTISTVFEATSNDNGNTVLGSASTSLPTAVMNVFGFSAIDLEVDCSASMGVGNSDVTMVLDTTGSMDSQLSGSTQTRIQALRAAMKNFYTTVSDSTAGSNARVRYAFVPYSSSVNVGRSLVDLDADYITDTRTIQSRAPVYQTVTSQVFDHWGPPVTTTGTGYSAVTNGAMTLYSSTQYKKDTDCAAALPQNSSWTSNGASSSSSQTTVNGNGQQVVTNTVEQPQKSTSYTCVKSSGRYYIYSYPSYRTRYSYTYETSSPIYRTVTSNVFDYFEYRPVQYDVSRLKLFESVAVPNGANGASVSYTWKGCIEERSTTAASSFTFSNLTGISPSGALDLDIDAAPESGNPNSQWAPMWQDVAYYRTTSRGSISNVGSSRYGAKANSYCPRAARTLDEISKDDFDAYADSLVAAGSTYHDLGMIWGARFSSPDGIFADLVNDPPTNGGEVSRHIIFMTDGIMEPNYTIQSSYGIEYHDRRVTADGYSNDASRHTSRFLAVCEAAKAKGIRIWVIAFSSALTTDLENCASDNSSFTASSASELNEAFQEIAKQVGELRIIQ